MDLVAQIETLAVSASPATLLNAARRLQAAATPQGSGHLLPPLLSAASMRPEQDGSPAQPRRLPWTNSQDSDDETSLPDSIGSRGGATAEAQESERSEADEAEWLDGFGRLNIRCQPCDNSVANEAEAAGAAAAGVMAASAVAPEVAADEAAQAADAAGALEAAEEDYCGWEDCCSVPSLYILCLSRVAVLCVAGVLQLSSGSAKRVFVRSAASPLLGLS